MKGFVRALVGVVVATSGAVMVVGPAGAKASKAPTVTSVVPDHGPVAGGTTVEIRGRNLTTATGVAFGSTPAAFTFSSANVIQATAPAATGAGTVDVTVTTPSGVSAVNTSDEFTYVTTPTIQRVVPHGGSTSGGTRVTIIGDDFTGVMAVSFGSVPAASYVVNSSISISAVSPPETAGTVDVRVTAADGTTPIDPADVFTFSPHVPKVTAVSPSSGPVGQTVTISGRFAKSGKLQVTSVDFGSTPAAFEVVNARTATAVAPSGTGTVDVTVSNADGTSSTTGSDEFTYIPTD